MILLPLHPRLLQPSLGLAATLLLPAVHEAAPRPTLATSSFPCLSPSAVLLVSITVTFSSMTQAHRALSMAASGPGLRERGSSKTWKMGGMNPQQVFR